MLMHPSPKWLLKPLISFQLVTRWRKAETCPHKTACMGEKSRQGHSSSTNLAALPPTREAFIENVKRAHFQAALQRSISVNPELSIEECRWKRYTADKTLCPTSLPDNTKPAPDYSLEITKCGCKTDTPCTACSTKKCSCRVKGLPYTIFCACFSVGCLRLQ